MNWLWAAMICGGAAAFEGLCAGRDPMGQLRALKQPPWSPPLWAWVLIGIAWYGICLAALVRLLPLWPEAGSAILLLVALMLANAAANIPMFRMRRLDLALLFVLPYWPLLGMFMWHVRHLDELVFTLFAIYAVYQVYAAAWGFQLWRMNRTT